MNNDKSRMDDIISDILDRTTSDPALLEALDTMRRNQDTHERAWHEARTGIVKKYDTKRTLNTMMVSIGGAEGVPAESLDRLERDELCLFDRKLRGAMLTMYATQRRELEALNLGLGSVDEEGMSRVCRVLDELLDERPTTQMKA